MLSWLHWGQKPLVVSWQQLLLNGKGNFSPLSLGVDSAVSVKEQESHPELASRKGSSQRGHLAGTNINAQFWDGWCFHFVSTKYVMWIWGTHWGNRLLGLNDFTRGYADYFCSSATFSRVIAKNLLPIRILSLFPLISENNLFPETSASFWK